MRRKAGLFNPAKSPVEAENPENCHRAELTIGNEDRFEDLFFQISTNLVGLTAQKMTSEIKNQLKMIVDYYGVDRGCLWAFSDDGMKLRIVSEYSTKSVTPIETQFIFDNIPWLFEKLYTNEPVIFNQSTHPPLLRENRNQYGRAEMGFNAYLSLPLTFHQKTIGVLSLDSISFRDIWPTEVIDQLRQLGELLSRAMIKGKEQKKFRELFEFEKTLSEISSKFANLGAKDVDKHIEKGLGQIGNLLNSDQVAYFETGYDLGTNEILPVLYSWANSGVNPIPRYKNLLAEFPWICSQLSKGQTVRFSKPKELPDDASIDKSSIRSTETKSQVSVPISVGGPVVGAINVLTVKRYRSWPDEIIPRLRLLGGVFANALMRKRKELEAERINKENNELFEFEKLLSRISSKFANLPAEYIDTEIERGLERIGKFLNADRVNHLNLDLDTTLPHQKPWLNLWVDKNIAPLPEEFDPFVKYPWVCSQLVKGKSLYFSNIEDIPMDGEIDKKTMRAVGTKSFVSVPISIGGPIVSAISVVSLNAHRVWPKGIIPRLRLVGEVFANALNHKKKEIVAANAFNEIKKLKSQIEADVNYLREEVDLKYDHHNMIGQSDAFQSMISKIHQIAVTNTTVLISGETGTGKELVARAIHANSQRKNRPMVTVNCAALSTQLIESELFGHEIGAFSGARQKRIGRFELANGNTLFLDEIGELPLKSQAKLLRVLQEGEFERIGSSNTIKVDVRIIAATNRNLENEVKSGRFRQDLWYRLNIFPIEMPPLRFRKEDIPLLSDYFTRKFSKKMGKTIRKIPVRVMETLQTYHWPGNIRELKNMLERAVIHTQGDALQLYTPLASIQGIPDQAPKDHTLDKIKRKYILQILEETQWRIEGPKGAALILGIHPSTLRSRMRKLKIQ